MTNARSATRSGNGIRRVGTPPVTSSDAGGGLDEIADLLGHASLLSSQVYLHPDPGRLRAAIDGVPSPRAAAAVPR
jgi:integrase